MAFADPQTINAQTLARTGFGNASGNFASADLNHLMYISHSLGRRSRRQIKYSHKKIVSDPLLAGTSVPVGMSVYLIVDVPQQGYTVAEAKAIVDAFTAYLTASTGARVTQLLGGEN